MSANRKWVDVNNDIIPLSSNEFSTPDDFFNALNKEFNFQADLACNEDNKKCEVGLYDSLNANWELIDGWLWLNPPYSPLKPWVQKAQRSYLHGAKIVMLIPPILNTKYFSEVLPTEIRFVVGRLKFIGADKIPMKSNSHDSCLVIYDGRNRNDFVKTKWISRDTLNETGLKPIAKDEK